MKKSLNRERFPKVEPPHILVLNKLLWGPMPEDSPIGHDVRPVGYSKGLSDIVVCDEDTDASRFEMVDDLANIFDGNRIYTREGFVKKNKTGA